MRTATPPRFKLSDFVRPLYTLEVPACPAFNARTHFPLGFAIDGVPIEALESFDAHFGGMAYGATSACLIHIDHLDAALPGGRDDLAQIVQDENLMHPFANLALAAAMIRGRATGLANLANNGISAFMRVDDHEAPHPFTVQGYLMSDNPLLKLTVPERNEELGSAIAWIEYPD